MKLRNMIKNLRIVYQRTTLLEGTIHLIRGTYKMTKVFILSIYWKHNFSKCGKNIIIFPKTRIDFPKNVEVGNNFSMNHASVLRSENTESKFHAENNVALGMHVMFDYSGGVEIGENTCISDYAHIHTHSHGLSPFNKPAYKKLRIGKNVWIGDGALILYQVSEIGDGAIIGARAVVTKDVPPQTIVAGNPSRIIRKIEYKEKIK